MRIKMPCVGVRGKSGRSAWVEVVYGAEGIATTNLYDEGERDR